MATQKTDASFEGMRVTLLDGTKDRIAKVGKTSYRTKGGVTIKADALKKQGRGLKEVDTGGSVTPKKASGKTPAKAAPKASDVDSMTRRDLVTALVESGKFDKRNEAKGISVDDLRAMVAGGKKGKKAAPAASGKKNKKDTASDISTMSRRDLVTALVEADVFSKRTEAKGISVDDLRDALENVRSGSSKKSKKKPAAAAAKTSDKKSKKAKKVEVEEEEDDKPSRRRRRVKSDESASASKKLKPVKLISDKLARSVEEAVNENVGKFIRSITGHDFTVACVGGVFNDERLTVQIGLLPTNASDEEIEAYAADMSDAESTATGQPAGDDRLEMLTELLGDEMSEDKIAKAIAGWDENFDAVIEPKLGDEVVIGTRLDYKGDEAIVVGFSSNKQKIVLFVVESGAVKLVELAKVVRMEILESPDAEQLEDEEDLDDELESDDDEEDLDDEDEEEFDEEDDDSEEDEDEDDDSEEDDEEEDFDDFDDEL